jgi:hypothetical protein
MASNKRISYKRLQRGLKIDHFQFLKECDAGCLIRPLWRPPAHKKAPKVNTIKAFTIYLCPGLDSNQHTLSGTTTSKWLVYQFQHLGK